MLSSSIEHPLLASLGQALLIMSLAGCVEETAPPISDVPKLVDMMTPVDAEVDISVPQDLDMRDEFDQMSNEEFDARLPVEPPPMPMEAVVKLGSEQTAAGELNRLSCLVYGDHGQVIPHDPLWGDPLYDIRSLEGWRWEDEDEALISGIEAGNYEVKCLIPSLGLRSDPRPWVVTPAEAKIIVTTIDRSSALAGDQLFVGCEIFDRFGNQIPNGNLGAINWNIEPPLGEVLENEEGESSVIATVASRYEVTCSVPEASGAELNPVGFEVLPRQPDRLRVYFASGRQVFSLDDIVRVRAELFDRYNNPVVGEMIQFELSPHLPSFGVGNYQAIEAGNYTVEARYDGDTESGLPLSDTRSFKVEDGAPLIRCDTPLLGAMTNLSSQTVSGVVSDLSSIASFTINGQESTLTAEGRFSESIRPAWGLNVVELRAVDQYGAESAAQCMFFASNAYLSEYTTISNVALMHLDQDAIDDGAPRAPIDSIGDLLGGMINSSQLITTIDQSLRAMNPIVPTVCRATIPIFGGCAFSAGARYNSIQVNGPNSISLDLITDGLKVDATIRGATIGLSTTGTVSTSGTVNVSSVRVIADLRLFLSGSTPQVTVVGTPRVYLGNITINLSLNISLLNISLPGIDDIVNSFINLVLDAFEGIIRDQVSSIIEDYITTEVDSLLSTTLNSLDLSALGFSLDLPRPLGDGVYSIDLNFSLSRLNVTNQRMQIGLRAQVSGDRLHVGPSAGIAVKNSERLIELDPGFNRDAAGAVHIGLINSVLHRLWRGRYFNINTEAQGINVELNLLTPPAIELIGLAQQVKLHLGPAEVNIRAPSLFADPVSLIIGGWASSSVSLNLQQELVFAPVTINDLRISSPARPLSAASLEAVSNVMVGLIQELLDDTLNDAIPKFPIPKFTLPRTLSAYGIPNGTMLGVYDLSLQNTDSHLKVRGNFR